jgi:hypothetical protein
MHHTTKVATKIGAGVAIAAVGLVASANAVNAYTMDATGKGFVGKGEVQFVFNLSNAKMQAAVEAKAFTFTAKQAAGQAYSSTAMQTATQTYTQVAYETGRQSASRTATQTGTQSIWQDVIETLSCTTTTGEQLQQSRHGVRTAERSATRTAESTATREATREAIRVGSRTGTHYGNRTGVRAGVLTGDVISDVTFTDKKTGQYTGFNLKGMSTSTFVPTGTVNWTEPTYNPIVWVNTITTPYDFPDYDFAPFQFQAYEFGPYEFPAYEFGPAGSFGPWDTEPTDPGGCLNNGDIVPGSLVQTTTYGAVQEQVVDGPVVEGIVNEGPVVSVTFNQAVPLYADPQYGPAQYGNSVAGAVGPTGPNILHVTYQGVTKALTPAV